VEHCRQFIDSIIYLTSAGAPAKNFVRRGVESYETQIINNWGQPLIYGELISNCHSYD
jgi:hypothetical protein